MERFELKELFQNKYNREKWLNLILKVFPEVNILNTPSNLSLTSDNVKGGVELGSFETSDGSLIGIFEINIDGKVQIEKNRVGLRNILRKYYKQIDGAFVVFFHASKWRFSFISETRVKDSKGNWSESKTEPKRFTYVLGLEETVKTAVDRFEILSNSSKKLADISDAFSVEKLSKEFFDKYKKQYELFVNYLLSNDFKDVVFDGNEKLTRDFVKKLLGRIVFIYFLQKKGWMGVPPNSTKFTNGDYKFLYSLFQKSGKDERFYSKWLKKLFFSTLNKPDRVNDTFKMPDGSDVRIPYLNGGLFENDDPSGYLEFPPDMFDDLFDFFSQYNFTVYEDSPEEQTVAVDPEMLGHIFENLLEDNKDKGAYYTPKEIVHYMCQESLIEYLLVKLNIVDNTLAKSNGKYENLFGEKKGVQLTLASKETKNNISRKEIELLIQNKELNQSIINLADDINKFIDDIRICDPAIGSGAFPMGLLNEIFILKQLLQPHLKKGKKYNNAKIKENIIQNSIYGVDLEKGAVDIARLRFWLSLIVDEDQPRPLPNLDYKIIVGNSLLPMFEDRYLRIKYEYQGSEKDKKLYREIEEQLSEIEKCEAEYFEIKENKDELRKHITNCKIDLLIKLLTLQRNIDERKGQGSLNIFIVSEKEELKHEKLKLLLDGYDNKINKLKNIKRYSKELNYFEWQLDFSQLFSKDIPESQRGFDIVIGNPPYIRADNPAIANLREEILNSEQYETLWEKWDIFVAFIEKGYKLLKENGILSMIISTGYMSSKYSERSHDYFINNATINRINFCSDLKIFDAGVKNIIIQYRKYHNTHNIPLRLKHIEKFENKIELPSKTQIELGQYAFKEEASNKAVGDISNSLLWGEICYISVGLVLQADELNFKGEFKKSDLISDSRDNDHSKIYTEAKWIMKYSIEKIKYLEWNTNRVPNKIRRPTFPELYTPLKIMFGGMTGAIIDETEMLCNHSILVSVLWKDLKYVNNLSINNSVRKDFKVKGNKNELKIFRKKLENYSSDFNLKYLLAVLNSKFGMHYLDSVRRSQLGFYPDDLKKLPIKIISLKEQEKYAKMVDKIMEGKKLDQDTSNIESELDYMIYNLYNLSKEEIMLIENQS